MKWNLSHKTFLKRNPPPSTLLQYYNIYRDYARIRDAVFGIANAQLAERTVIYVGAFKLQGLLIFFSGMDADRNVKVVGGDVAVL